MSASAPPRSTDRAGYRHEAVFYAGPAGFLDAVVPFVRAGVEQEEPVLVVVSAEKIARLREALGGDADRVLLADMDEVGANPARIIPAWTAFLGEHAPGGRPARGVGEPIHPGRRREELAECHRHEALLNLAFADRAGFWLVCPYDTTALPEEVLHEAERTHPLLRHAGAERASAAYPGVDAIARPFDDPLPPPPGPFNAIAFDVAAIADVRRFVAEHAAALGLPGRRAEEFVVAVSEIASNSIRHGGGSGVVRTWVEGDTLVCEVRDRGAITDPLAGRVAPEATRVDGRGLWIANQVCDLVQVRALPDGGAVRLHVRR